MTNINGTLNLPLPKGSFTIMVGDKKYSETNAFTVYGLSKILTPGATVFSNSGGMFPYCKVGTGTESITRDSIAMGEVISGITTIIAVNLTFFSEDGVRYAQQTVTYNVQRSISTAVITEIGLTEFGDGGNLLCGKLLEGPIPVTGELPLTILYSVRIPIFSEYISILDVPPTNIGIGVFGYSFNMRTFIEVDANTIVCCLPAATPRITNSPYSTFNISNIPQAASLGSYTCIRTTQNYGVDYDITAVITGTSTVGTISKFSCGYSTGAPDSVQVAFDGPPFPTKPPGWKFKVHFGVSIKWLE